MGQTTELKEKTISKDTTFVTLLRDFPEAVETLTKYGFLLESLEEARAAKGMPEEAFQKVLEELQEFTKPLKLTPLAVEKVVEIMKEEKKDGQALRVRAVPGGMGGVQYEFAFEEKAEDGDTTFTFGALDVYLDQMTLNVMDGSTIDFVEGPQGSGFKVDNPNVPKGGGGGGGGCGSGGGCC